MTALLLNPNNVNGTYVNEVNKLTLVCSHGKTTGLEDSATASELLSNYVK